MAWDDTPPDTPATAAWDATPPQPGELKPSYLSDVVSNAGKEIVNFPKSIPTMAQGALGLADLPLDALKAAPQLLSGKNLSDTDVAQDIKPVIEGNKNTLSTIEHPVESFRKAPINTAMTAAGLFGGVKGMVPEAEAIPEIPKTSEIPPAAPGGEGLHIIEPGAKAGEPHALFAYNDEFGPEGAKRPVYNIYGDPNHPALKQRGWGSSLPKEDIEAAGIPIKGREPNSLKFGEPATPASSPGGAMPPGGGTTQPGGGTKPPLTETLANNAVDKANELKNYISKGYEGYAKKPGTATDIADYVQEKSQMMAAQQMGATPLQARQIGHEGLRALGQYALDNDIVSPTTGLKGMRAKTTALNDAAGKIIGDIRKQADSMRVPAETSVDTLQAVRQKLDPVFARGSRSGESGAYAKALEDLEDAKPTFQGMSDLATKLNKAANEANRLNQPHGAYTDVANEVSHINNERIKALVGTEKAAQYEQALRDFGATKKIGEFLNRKEAGEVKRFGPGSVTSNLTQKLMDEFGYRAGAKIANKVSSAIKSSPSIAKTAPSLFKEFINQVEDVGHEVTGMSKGGMVPDDVKNYVSARGC